MDNDFSGGKNSLRREFSARRKRLSSCIGWKERCAAVQAALLVSDAWGQAENVVLYASLPSEISTDLLLQAAWQGGKNVFLPRCRPQEKGMMDMLLCRSATDLEKSSMGIAEPLLTRDSRFLREGENALVVVPALAFDRQGFRLGYGGGYYDRFLAGKEYFSVGLSVRELVAEKLPRNDWDRPVSALCTEEGLRCCHR